MCDNDAEDVEGGGVGDDDDKELSLTRARVRSRRTRTELDEPDGYQAAGCSWLQRRRKKTSELAS